MKLENIIKKYQLYILLLTVLFFLPFLIYFIIYDYPVAYRISIIVLSAFILSYFLTINGRSRESLVISLLAFIFNACIGLFLFGSEYGTQYYLLVINVFFSGNVRSHRILNLLFILFNFSLYLFFTMFYTINDPLYILPLNHLYIIRQINIALSFSFLCISFYLYAILLKNSEKELEKSHNKILRMAHTDTLTDLPNRRSIEDELLLILPCKNDQCKRLAIALVDIDYFKKINDTYGHKAGDEVLKELARRFNKLIRNYDFLGRWGGEEFIFIFKETNIDMAFTTVERIRQSIESEPIKTSEGNIKVTLTFGLTSCSSKDNEDSIFKRVDSYLYEGKQKGRNITITDKAV